MKRKIVYISVSYALGLLSAFLCENKSGILIVLSGFLVLLSVCKYLEKGFKELLIMIIPFIISFGVYNFYNTYVYETLLDYNETDVSFKGKIIDITDYAQDKSGYIIDGTINNLIDAKIICYDTSYSCKNDDIISFDCTMKEIEGDYLFDSKNYYKAKNIFLRAENITNVKIENYDGFSLKNILYDFRDGMISRFKRTMDYETGVFLSAMVFGDKSDMDDSSETALYRSGIGHIMAISGIHVSVISVFLMGIFKKLHIGKFISFVILCIFLLLMIIIVESPMSVIRATIMILIFYGADFFRRENDTLNSLSISVFLICLSNPFVIHNQGFLLSVSGTYGIGVFAPYMTKNIDSKIIKNVLSMIYVSICVIPLSIIYFDEVSIISPLANLILIPLCSFSLIIGLVFVLTGGFVNLLFIAEFLIKIVMFVTDLIGRSSGVYIGGGSDFAFAISIVLLVTGVILHLIFKKPKVINILMSFGILFLFGYNYVKSLIDYNTFKITFLGRNQNIAVVLSYHGNTDIIDLSGHYKNPAYVKKYLSRNCINDINNILLTKRQASLFVSYQSALNLTDIENIIIFQYVGGIPDKNVIFYDENEVNIKYSDYLIRYDDNILHIESDKYSLCISPYKYNQEDMADIFVFYGNKKDIDMPERFTICIDECDNCNYSNLNNFSLNFSKDSFKIRRL